MARRISLVSPHDPVALANRLKAAVAQTLTPASRRQVTGNGTEHVMTLWVHRPNLRNDFKTVLNATIAVDGSGSRIEGRIGLPAALQLFTGCWFGIVLLFLISTTPFLLAVGARGSVALPVFGIPLAMLVFGALLVTFARRSGRSDEAEILAFLSCVVDTRKV